MPKNLPGLCEKAVLLLFLQHMGKKISKSLNIHIFCGKVFFRNHRIKKNGVPVGVCFIFFLTACAFFTIIVAVLIKERQNIAWKKEVQFQWKWHSSRRKGREAENMVSVKEWEPQTAERYLLQEEEKAEKYYPRKKAQSYAFSRHFFITKTYTKAADCGLLFV